ncbi:hypothetical protein, conserved [Plasmodium gonderi]|uniref:Uncharacterized protein n=1 Tax=Plasmodium gonderi TaxID=77519 RepID=A0A1Y1JDW5_PLAGO|nr:hypothetical protein, conserved [Plasmodium gonderi]GAW78942.1 hypothetical protein, conserved [Plasmodium gonderi]
MFLNKLLFLILCFTLMSYVLLISSENRKLKNYYTLNKNCLNISPRSNQRNSSLIIKKKFLTLKQGKYNSSSQIPWAFLVFDIIKIFGRLSDQELLGHVISHNNEFIELNKNKKKVKKWENLFLSSNNSINFEILKSFLNQTKFEWPLTINSGQIQNQGSISIPVSPIVYVENCRKISEMFRSKNKNTGTDPNVSRKINLKIINEYVSEQSISNDAIECVFSSFSDFSELTMDQFINKIHEWAPSDGIVDWYTFVYNLKEEPLDNIKRFFD